MGDSGQEIIASQATKAVKQSAAFAAEGLGGESRGFVIAVGFAEQGVTDPTKE
jgi:hypothetical protein